MARVILQSATPILALLREVRETRRPFAKGGSDVVRTHKGTEGELSRW
jgi:hypothetical protein